MKWKIEGGHCEGPANDPINDFETVEEADTLMKALLIAHMNNTIPCDSDIGWISVFPSEEN